MTVKISAEFDSVDRAELVARNIRDTVKDVSHIHIHTRKGTPVDNFYTSTEMYSDVAVMSSYSNPYYTVLPYSELENKELSNADEATVEVCCPKSEENVVSSKLSAFGGLRVKKRAT